MDFKFIFNKLMENNIENNIENINQTNEIEEEKEILCLTKIDNNLKLAIGLSNSIITFYNQNLTKKIGIIKDQPSYFLFELSGKTNKNGIKLLCCSYSFQIKILEIIFKNDNKIEYNTLYIIEPNESRNEINKAIEINNENKDIVSIDDQNVIIYRKNKEINKYMEIKKINAESANDILNLNENMFCVSLKNKGILQFYNNKDFSLINEIKKIESFGSNNYLCKLNENILCVGGFEYISLIDIDFEQVNNKMELLKNRERITSTCGVIENRWLIVGTKYKDNINSEFLFDIIVYKLNNDNVLQEIKRFQNAHDKIINSIIYINGNIISCSEDKKIKKWSLSELINLKK